ncbi:MAG: ABC transporter permease subunit [Alphaproteobacteria bacterium]|nr:ABC transporter permease subunit [Alphaproteobacteria bacterium]
MRELRPIFIIVVLLVGITVFGPFLAPNDPTAIDIPNRLSAPSEVYPLGSDAMGRCILSRLLYGARWSLGLAFLVSTIGLIVGSLMGLLAAMGGRKIDWCIMRVTDIFLAFPDLVAAVVIVGVLGGGTNSLILALSVTSWTRYARVARGIGLGLSSRGYVIQARLVGLSAFSIARWHYMPTLTSSLVVVWTGMLARAILGISALGFLGFGVQPPTPEWGTMLLDARIHILSTPLQMIWPGMAVLLCVLTINITGDVLRDALAKKEIRP